MSKERKARIKGREKFERDAKIIRLVGAGMTTQEISDLVGASWASVYGAIRRLGLNVKRVRSVHIPVEEAAKRFRSGETMTEIASSYGVSRQAVQISLAKIGITKFDGGYAKRAHDEYLARQAAAE